MNGPVNPLGTTRPDGSWYPSRGGPAMCDGERVTVIDILPAAPYAPRVPLIRWPHGLDQTVPLSSLSPVPEYDPT